MLRRRPALRRPAAGSRPRAKSASYWRCHGGHDARGVSTHGSSASSASVSSSRPASGWPSGSTAATGSRSTTSVARSSTSGGRLSAGVEPPLAQPGDERRRSRRSSVCSAMLGVPLAERAHDRRHDVVRHGGEEADPQLALLAACRATHRLDRSLGLREHRARLAQQDRADVGQRDAARAALEQRHAELQPRACGSAARATAARCGAARRRASGSPPRRPRRTSAAGAARASRRILSQAAPVAPRQRVLPTRRRRALRVAAMTSPDTSRIWLITGSSSGFGRQLAQAALEHGDRVVATARRPETLDDLVATAPDRVPRGRARRHPTTTQIDAARRRRARPLRPRRRARQQRRPRLGRRGRGDRPGRPPRAHGHDVLRPGRAHPGRAARTCASAAAARSCR